MNNLNRHPGFQYMDLDDFEELLADKPDNEKWELIGRRVVKMMVGARWDHNRIAANILTALMTGLRAAGSPCRPFAETFWLKQRFLDLAVFPDIIVQCGPLHREATSTDNPTVLFEIVSPGSEQRDRVEKWALYQRLPSLQHYVLVERKTIAVDVFDRVEGGWLQRPRIAEGMVVLAAIDFSLPVAEMYREVLAG